MMIFVFNRSLQHSEVKLLSSEEDNQSFLKKVMTAATFFGIEKVVYVEESLAETSECKY